MASTISLREQLAPVPISIPPDLFRSGSDALPPPVEAHDVAMNQPWQERLISFVPSWLVSLIVHLVAVIVLALVTIPPVAKSVTVFLSFAGVSGDQGELIDTVTVAGGGVPAADALSSSAAVEAFLKATTIPPSEHFLLPSSTAAAVEAGEIAAPPGFGDLMARGSGSGSGISGAGGSGLGGYGNLATQFFGVKAGGRKFVYIIDSSGSMEGDKFAAAKEEVIYAITHLEPEQSFYVFFFDQVTEQMKLPPDEESPPYPVPATRQNVQRATKWIKRVKTGSNTYPYDAVKLAVEMMPDAIFLLSDGQFSDRGKTEVYLLTNNVIDEPIDGRRIKVAVNTICFWDLAGQESLQRIAQHNRGVFRYIPPGGR